MPAPVTEFKHVRRMREWQAASLRYFALALVAAATTAIVCSAADLSLSGIVADRITGAPVRNAHVALMESGEEAVSDASGRFQFAHLDSGSYLLRVTKTGFDEDDAAMTQLTLTAPRSDLVIRLTPLASIQGQVTDAEGEPAASVVVVAWQVRIEDGLRRYVAGRQASTDDRGHFRLPLLPAGRYLVQAAGRDAHGFFGEPETAHETHETFAPVYFGGARDRSSAAVLPLKPGEEARADISIAIEAGHRICGHIENLKPGTQPTFQLLSGEDGLGLSRSSVDFAAGNFELRDVLDGTYRLRVVGVGADNKPLVAEREITVSGGDMEGLTLKLGPGLTLRGEVRVEGFDGENAGQALEGFQVQLSAPESVRALGAEEFNSAPPAEGAFHVAAVIPGRYRVAFQVPEPSYVSAARAGDQDLLAEPELRIPADSPPEIEVVLRSDGGSVEGTVGAGSPLPHPTCLVLVPESLSRPPALACTEDGDFAFAGVAPGTYRLHAWKAAEAESVEYNKPEVRRTLAANGMRVEVRAAARTEVHLQTLSEISQ